jgi:hypothetical protein
MKAELWTGITVVGMGFGGIIFRAGQLTNALKELTRRVEKIEGHIWPK